MKYLKKYETLSENDKLRLISKIKKAVVEITLDNNFENDYEDIENCPFLTEICIIHQQEYIDELFWVITNWNIKNLSIGDFREIYNILLNESTKTILYMLEKDPKLYSEWKDIINIDVPDYIIKSDKYNL